MGSRLQSIFLIVFLLNFCSAAEENPGNFKLNKGERKESRQI